MNILLDGRYNGVIEASVTAKTGSPFHIKEIQKIGVGAMHSVAIFVGECFSVFVKAGTNDYSEAQFRAEAWELDYIRAHSSVRTPQVIDVVKHGDTALLILEEIRAVKPETAKDFEILGRGLASLHQQTSDRCGFERETYLGIFKQDNTWKPTWTEFYGECRLRDTLGMAIRAGRMNREECERIEKLIERLPALSIEPKVFSLLHGDPWLGNLMFDGKELVLIDCSLYYGNREIDLTTVDFFNPVPKAFFDAYHEVFPIEDGFADRADLWEINQWLGHVTLYGDKYKEPLWKAVERYI